MKKLMALCLSLLMVLSMCSFTVFAEDEAAVVTFADIANGQPQNFVTGNLVLGTNDVITSSNEAVIATNGTVKRPLFEDATVSLTINGGDAVEVTVKAQTTNVLYANDFSTGVGSEWSLPVVGTNTPSAVANGVLNMVIGDTTSGRTNLNYSPAAISGTRPVTMAFDMSNITGLAASGADIRISGSRYDAEGNKIGGFSTITVARCNSTSGFGIYWMGAYRKSNVEIKYNPTTGEFWGNGVLHSKNLMTCADTNFTYNSGKTAEDCAKVVITNITITNAGGGCTATFDMDNFVYYEDVPAEDVLKNSTVDEQKEYFSQYLTPEVFANGQSLASISSNLTFSTGIDMEALDASLEWTTSDPTVIGTDGTIHPKQNTSVNATVQGTLTIGEETIKTKPYNIKLAPLGTVECTEAKLNWDFEDATVGTATTTPSAGYDPAVSVRGLALGGSYEYVNDVERGMILSSTNPGQIQFYAGQRGPGYDNRYVYGFDYKFSLKEGKTSTKLETHMYGNNTLYIGTDITGEDIKVGDDGNDDSEVYDLLWASKVPCYDEITRPDVWHHIDIDYNATKNVYSIYVDDNLINSIPGSSKDSGYYAMYWIQIQPQAYTMASFQLDNVYVNKYTDSDIVKADGALRRAVYNAAARETGQNGQPGPYRTINRTDLDSVITSGSVPTPQTDSNGAVLTWKVNGEPHTEATYTAPAGAKSATFEVTASYNGKSVSQTFTNRFAPVEITGYTVEDGILKSVTVEGNYTGKQLTVVSVSTADGKVNNVKLIDITDTTVTLPDDSVNNNGNKIYFYVYDEETLLPYAFKR